MAFIKIYNGEHLEDVGMSRCWTVSFRYKFNPLQKKELENATKKIAADTIARLGDGNVGYQVNDKTVKIWHADRDSQGEYLARNISDDLLKLVKRKWSDGGAINPSKLSTPLLS